MAPGFHSPKANTSKDLLQAIYVGGDPETTIGRSSSETCLWIVESLGVPNPPKMSASQGGGIRVHVLLRIGATRTRVCVSHTVLCVSVQHSLQAFSVLLKIKVTVVAMVMPKPLVSRLYVWGSCSPAHCLALLSRKHCHKHLQQTPSPGKIHLSGTVQGSVRPHPNFIRMEGFCRQALAFLASLLDRMEGPEVSISQETTTRPARVGGQLLCVPVNSVSLARSGISQETNLCIWLYL